MDFDGKMYFKYIPIYMDSMGKKTKIPLKSGYFENPQTPLLLRKASFTPPMEGSLPLNFCHPNPQQPQGTQQETPSW